MATLVARLGDLITALGTDYKAVRTMIGTLSSLTTTDKTSVVLAINEVRSQVSSHLDETGVKSVIDDYIQTEGNISKTPSEDGTLVFDARLPAVVYGGNAAFLSGGS